MDPNAAYLELIEAIKARDYEQQREIALSLQDWFRKGGFYPYQYSRLEIDATISNILRNTGGN